MRFAISTTALSHEVLTTREKEVLHHMSYGSTNSRVASKLGLSEETVKTHVRHILDKLQARNRGHAIAIGLRTGLIE